MPRSLQVLFAAYYYYRVEVGKPGTYTITLEIEKGSRDTVDAGGKNVTFQAALEQAIHTNDQQLLNKCFTVSSHTHNKQTKSYIITTKH